MKRALALLLCLVLCLTLLPAALAEDITIIDTEDAEEAIVIIEPETAEPETAEPEAVPQASAVAGGICGDDLTWTLYNDGLLQINGSGDMYDYPRETAPWYSLRSDITSLSIWVEVTHIGDYAFYGCTKLNWSENQGGRSLPSMLKSIGSCAFLSCSSLTYLDVGSHVETIGDQAFDYCYALRRVTFRGTPSIGSKAFGDCRGLEEISFLGGVPTFDSLAFGAVYSGNEANATAWYPPDNSAWTSSVRQNYGGTLNWLPGYCGWCGDNCAWSLDASSGLLTITGSGAIWDYVTDMNVEGGQASRSIVSTMTALDSKIRSASVGEGITFLGDNSLMLRQAESISLPSTLKRIAHSALNNCKALTTLDIPASVTQIDYSAFYYCQNLKTIRFLGHPPTINPNAFMSITASVSYFPLYSWSADKRNDYGGKLTWVVDDKVGDKVRWALDENGLLSLSGTGPTADYSSGFPNYYKFKNEILSAELGDGITRMGHDLFYGLNCLKEVDLGTGLTEVGKRCFYGCTALDSVRFRGSAPSFETTSFKGVTTKAIYPAGASWTEDVRQNYGGTITWTASALPTITTHPESQSAALDATVKFTVKASGAESYQWQYKKNASDSWHNSGLSSAKTATLSIKATASVSGYQYRCLVSNTAGTRTTSAATLTVMTKPTITAQPKSVTAAADSTVSFTVAASGSALSYQWQYKKNASDSWHNSGLSSAKTATLKIKATSGVSGYQYRCAVTNAAGTTNSSAAKLTVVTKPTITTQPKSVTAAADATVSFTVTASGGALSYQWQYRTSASGSWHNSGLSSAKTATLKIKATASVSGYQYRCVITNAAGSTNSSAATLTVK